VGEAEQWYSITLYGTVSYVVHNFYARATTGMHSGGHLQLLYSGGSEKSGGIAESLQSPSPL
jgi:hypothetical protein